MNYQDELIAKLEATRPDLSVEKSNTVTTNSLEEKLLGELSLEFELSQYDLDENDILRTFKINDMLKVYAEVFIHPEALKVFYRYRESCAILRWSPAPGPRTQQEGSPR